MKSQSLSLPRASARQLSAWRKLGTKKGRREAGQFLLEGVRTIAEAVASESTVSAIVVADDNHGHEAWKRVSPGVSKRRISAFLVSPRDMEKLTGTVHAAGIACALAWKPLLFDQAAASTNLRRVLICDRVADPGNLGTLIRTAAGLGLDAVFLLPETAELTNPKTLRAAAGAFLHIPVYEDAAIESIKAWARRAEVPIIVADAHRGDPSLPKVSRRWALVVGGETIPLDKVWEKAASHWIAMPLQRGVESLNAAIAGAIIMDRLCRESEAITRHPPRRPT